MMTQYMSTTYGGRVVVVDRSDPVPGGSVVGAGVSAVAGVGPGPASFLLPERLFGGLGDLEGDPVAGAGALDRSAGGCFDRDVCAHAGLG